MPDLTVSNQGDRTIVVGKVTVAPGATDVVIDSDAFAALVESGPAGKALASDLKQKTRRRKTSDPTESVE